MDTAVTLEQIDQVLEEQVRPRLLSHGGNLTLLGFEEGIVKVRFTGQCSGCPSADLTMETLVRDKLTAAIPQIKDVVLEQSVSEDLLAFAKKILNHEVDPDVSGKD